MRTYYDHEPAYRKIAAMGGRGWDDAFPDKEQGSYHAVQWFIESQYYPRRNVKVLDLGCGGGQVAIQLAGLGFEVSGVDYSETAIELARRNAAEVGLTIDFQVGDALTLADYRDATFDLVIDNHVLHCLVGQTDGSAFLRSARRILKAGGLLFSETRSAEGTVDMDAFKINPRTRVDAYGRRYWVCRTELNSELRSAGFDVLYQQQRQQLDSPAPGDLIVTVAVAS